MGDGGRGSYLGYPGIRARVSFAGSQRGYGEQAAAVVVFVFAEYAACPGLDPA